MNMVFPYKVHLPRWLVICGVLACLAVGAAFFTYLGSELRRVWIGLAPLDRTVAYVKHPVLPKSVHVFVVPNEQGGCSVRAWVYEGDPDWMSYGHDLGEIGAAAGMRSAAQSFGTVRFTDAGVTIGSGNTCDPVLLSKQDLESTR